MIITKKNQVEHKIIKLDRFRRSCMKIVPQNEHNEPITLPLQQQQQQQLQQDNQLQFQDKPIQYYTNNNFIYNNVSPLQFPQSFIENTQNKEIPLNKSKSISFIVQGSQVQRDFQSENGLNGNMFLTPGFNNNNFIYNKTPTKITDTMGNKSKQVSQTQSKWNMLLMPCQSENMEIVNHNNNNNECMNDYNCNSNNSIKEESTVLQTEHNQFVIENTPNKVNYEKQLLLGEVIESENKQDDKQNESKNDLVYKGDINTFDNDNNDTTMTTLLKVVPKIINERNNNGHNITMRNILPFNKVITPLFSNTNPTASLETKNNTNSNSNNNSNHTSKIKNTSNINKISPQIHHQTPSLQINNIKRLNTERPSINLNSNNRLLETISFNQHHHSKANNPSTINPNSKQIRAIILKESITEVNNTQQIQNDKSQTKIITNTCENDNYHQTNSNTNNTGSVMHSQECINNPSLHINSNRIENDIHIVTPHTTKNSMSKLVKATLNQPQITNFALKGKSFLTPKGNDNDKKNILFPSFLKNDKIAIMKYKNLLKNTSQNTPTSTPCVTNNNINSNNNNMNVNNNNNGNNKNAPLAHNDNVKNNGKNSNSNVVRTEKKQTTTRSKGVNMLNNRTKYKNVINSFFSNSDIPKLSYKHSFVETKRNNMNLFTKLALPANNFDNDKDKNSKYIHI